MMMLLQQGLWFSGSESRAGEGWVLKSSTIKAHDILVPFKE